MERIIYISDIVEIRQGHRTDRFNRIVNRRKHCCSGDVIRSMTSPIHDEHRCFSIVLRDKQRIRTVDLVTSSGDLCDMWVRCLRRLVTSAYGEAHDREPERWLRAQFNRADRDNNGVLSRSECKRLLKQMNVSSNQVWLDLLISDAVCHRSVDPGPAECNSCSRLALTVNDFTVFYWSVFRLDELERLFAAYARGAAMTTIELARFLREEQREEHVTRDLCSQIIADCENTGKSTRTMSKRGFYRLMRSRRMEVLRIEHSTENNDSVCQDLTHPLAHYYIASSHNTYLEGNQLSSRSSVEAYIAALKSGCRCVELDCWDGDNDTPIIKHGYTLTTHIYFRDVIVDAVQPYAFHASDSPLILSIENHCSVSQQRRMASCLREVLGDCLYDVAVDTRLEALPSPADLRGRILIKMKKLSVHMESVVSMPVCGGLDDRGSCDQLALESSGYGGDRDSESFSNIESSSSIDEAATSTNTAQPYRVKKLKLDPSLSHLVNYIQAIRFRSFEESLNAGRWWTMSSFSESRALRMISDSADQFVDYNRRQLSRIYPSRIRQSSSNLSPHQFWSVGCQMVALNYQTCDRSIFYNRALFRLYGGCGYVLKPEYLRSGTGRGRVVSSRQLSLRIISASHLPKPSGSGSADIVDPYVCVYMVGAPSAPDTDTELKLCTSVVRNNGFCPVWNETLTLSVPHGEAARLCLVCLLVFDRNKHSFDTVLGLYSLSVDAIAEGYRYVPLEDVTGKRIKLASLFVHVSFNQ